MEVKDSRSRVRLIFISVLSCMLVIGVGVSLWNLLSVKATPNPGHPWSEIGNGTFQVSSTQTALHTYVFPDTTSTVLTSFAPVTIAQGGTGAATFTSGLVLQGNGSTAVSAIATSTVGNILTASSTGWAGAPDGFQFLGSMTLGSAAANTGVLTIPARDILLIAVRITGYSNAEIASLRFNGDTAAHYWYRYVSSAQGTITFTNNQNTAQTLAPISGLTEQQFSRSVWAVVSNDTGTSKVGAVTNLFGSGAVNTADNIQIGGFEWVNTTAQITSVQLVTQSGRNMNAGSGFAVYGTNF